MSALFALMLPAAQGALLYVTDPDANTLWLVNEAGVKSAVLGAPGGLNAPTGVAAGPGGVAYVADSMNDRVLKYDPMGGIWSVFATGFGVSSIAVDLLGNVFAASNVEGQVRKYDSSGAMITSVGADAPTAIAVNAAGDVFVALTNGAFGLEVRTFANSLLGGSTFFAASNDPYGLAFSDGDLYGTNLGTGEVEKFDPLGPAWNSFTSGSSFPIGLAFAPDGTLYVASSTEIQRFSASGTFIDSFGGVFTSVSGLAFSTVPEPGTYAMIGIGLIGLSLVGRKRRSAAARVVRRD